MLCPFCNIHNSIENPIYGILPCGVCLEKQERLNRPGKSVEFTSDEIKEGRKIYKNDIEQPHRKGELNKRWVELYGKDKALKQGFTEKEIKNAKYVFSGDEDYYNKNN